MLMEIQYAQLDVFKGRLIQAVQEDEPCEYGVWNGKVGKVILYHVLSRYTGDRSFNEKAGLLLDAVFDDIGRVETMDFAKGLSGIGWAMEWLKENKYLVLNTDEILGEIDDELYRGLIAGDHNELSLKDGILGDTLYFLKRYQSVNYKTRRFQIITLQDCLVMQTDRIFGDLQQRRDLLLSSFTLGRLQRISLFYELSELAVLLSKLSSCGVNAVKVEKSMYSVIEIADQLFLNSDSGLADPEEKSALLSLAYACRLLGLRYHCGPWQQKSEEVIRQILNDELLGIENLSLSCKFSAIQSSFISGNASAPRYSPEEVMLFDLAELKNEFSNWQLLLMLLTVIGAADDRFKTWEEMMLWS